MKPTQHSSCPQTTEALEEPRCRPVASEMMIDYLSKCQHIHRDFTWRYVSDHKTNPADINYCRRREGGKNRYQVDLMVLPRLLRLSLKLFCTGQTSLELVPSTCLLSLLCFLVPAPHRRQADPVLVSAGAPVSTLSFFGSLYFANFS